MKISAGPFSGMISLICLTITISCTYVYFDRPQPVNAKNLKRVPKELQGIWTYCENEDDLPDSIIIDDTSYRSIYNEYNFILKSDLEIPDCIYKIKGDKIYYRDDSVGFPIRIVNDTVYFTKCRGSVYTLTDTTFLRKAGNCYVYNIKNGRWWEIIIIQKSENGVIRFIYPQVEDLLKARLKYEIKIDSVHGKSSCGPDVDSVYFRTKFKAKDIDKIISDSSDVLLLLLPDSTSYGVFLP